MFVSTLFLCTLKKIWTKHHRKLQKTKTCRGRSERQENFMRKIKEDILNDAKKGNRDTTNSSNETTSSTNNPSNKTARSNDTYIYGVGIVAALAIGACVFFAYNTFQPKNKKRINEKQNQQPKRRHML